MKIYTKPGRYNLVLSLEQYKVILERKRIAHENDERVPLKDLADAWGIKQHHLATAVHRGIKQYDYIIWKESQKNERQDRHTGSGIHQSSGA